MLGFDTDKYIDGINCLNKKDRSPYFTNMNIYIHGLMKI